jgi:hypothetical protein
MKPVSKVAKPFHSRVNTLLSSADNYRLLLTSVLLRGMKSGTLEQFGFDCSLHRISVGDTLPRTALLNALLDLPEKSVTLAAVFSASDCRKFLQIHESGGVEWFNKERFEELAEWLSIVSLLVPDKLSLTAGNLSTLAAEAEKELNRSIALAAHAGYRTGLFLNLLATSTKTATTEKPSARGIKEPKPDKSEPKRKTNSSVKRRIL